MADEHQGFCEYREDGMSEKEPGLFPLDDWRTSFVATGQAPTDVLLRKEFVTEIQPGEDRTIKFVITTGSADREKDVINASGWDTTNYLKNPVVLFAHDYDSLPVARTTSLTQVGDTLVAEAQFADAGLNPVAEQVYQMLKQGFLRGASVGFRPLTYEFNEERGGVDFEKQELLEFSVVPVPANPGALMSAGVKAADVELITKWAKDTLAGFGALTDDVSVPEKPVSGPPDESVIKPATEPVAKQPVRDQLDDFLDVIRKAMNDIKVAVKETIRNVDEFQNTFQYTAVNGDNKSVDDDAISKGVTPPNPSGFGEAPVSEAWEKPTLGDFTSDTWGDLSAAERRAIATHFAWAESREPENFGEMKLPHHKASGDVVWRGVASAAAFLDATQLPSADVGAVKRHLASHYRQFDREAPWERDGAGWSAYCKARAKLMAKIEGSLTSDHLAHLLDDFGFEDEAVALVTVSAMATESEPGGVVVAPSPSPGDPVHDVMVPVLDALDRLGSKLDALTGEQAENPAPTDAVFFQFDDAETIGEFNEEDVMTALRLGLNDTIGEVVGSQVRAAINSMRGRID